MRGLFASVAPVTTGAGSLTPGAPRWRGRSLPWVAVGALAMVAALPVAAHAEPAPPPELLLNVAIGPAPTLRSFAAYVEAVKPGSGVAISEPFVRAGLASAAGVSSLDGFDPASWTYLLVASVEGTPAIAVVSKVRDAKQLTANVSAGASTMQLKGGWAIVGPKPVVDLVDAWALAALPAQRAPSAMNATVYVPNVLAAYKAQIEQARANMVALMSGPSIGTMGPMMTSYVDGILSGIADTEKAVITLETTAELASLDLALFPRAGTRLAKFVSMQRPSNYALLDRLPEMSAAMIFGGHLELGPFRQGMLEMTAKLYGPADTQEMLAGLEAVAKVATGEMAMATRFSPGAGMSFTQLFGVSDTAAADRAFAALFALFGDGKVFEAMGIGTKIKVNPGTVTHNGVAMRSYEASYDLSKVPAADRKAMEAVVPKTAIGGHVAAFDHLGLVALAPNSQVEAERAVDAARGKAPHFTAPAVAGQMLASSRARKDSMAAVLDIGAILSAIPTMPGAPPRAPIGPIVFVLSFGCADRHAHFRIAAPASSARTAVNAAKP
ncbi:MAG TPA: hypothetical protein VLM79_28735 [Kofleriaceae bacterium]|nr:hypothetical protein [Kofleriaceae bacterium]